VLRFVFRPLREGSGPHRAGPDQQDRERRAGARPEKPHDQERENPATHAGSSPTHPELHIGGSTPELQSGETALVWRGE
jgi:hypothetical protein